HRFWKTGKSVQDLPESVFKTYQNGCSRVTRIGVQVVPEYALPVFVTAQKRFNQLWRLIEAPK
ncbi:MAG: hypothetical protein B0D91_04640, partial [Oceanospirillales bacterium LUC14_002_19_P2]